MRGIKDPFKELGLDADANDSQVKKAYRKLALRYAKRTLAVHPITRCDIVLCRVLALLVYLTCLRAFSC